MKLERHVGGLSRARKVHYLEHRGWRGGEGKTWVHPDAGPEGFTLDRALHHQLTTDLTRALVPSGWRVLGFSARGYARLEHAGLGLANCSLPKALRVQARREKRAVRELTYSFFLAALLEPGVSGPT